MNENQQDFQTLSQEEIKINQQFDSASKAISKLLNIESFRVYCKQEVLKEFDGDYNFLLSKIVKDYKNSQNNFTFYSTQSVKTDYVDTSIWPQELMDVLDQTYQDYPLTQIAIQVDPVAWNPSTYIPNVVYMDSQYDEADTDFVNGYDANGNPIQINARVEPTLPVVILSTNERGYIDNFGDYIGYNSFPSYVITDQNQATSALLNPVNPNTPIEYYRPNFTYENISRMKYENLSQVEGWVAGAPETYIYVFEQDPTDPSKTIRKDLGYSEPPKRKQISGVWYGTDIDTHLWRWYNSGTVIKYGFYEHDNKGLRAVGENLIVVSNYQSFILDSLKVYPPGSQQPNLPSQNQPAFLTIVKFIANVTGQFFAKNMEKSETIGEIEVSVNNRNTEISLLPGGFKFQTSPK